MAVEIEAKMKVADLSAIRQRLQAAGASPTGKHLETNIFLDTEDRSLLARDQGLRLRVNRDLATQQAEYIVTHKGPRLHGQLKSREETELAVSNMQDTLALLQRLGYSTVLSFEKRRESWTLDGCKVELDEVPYLGTFVEIEGSGEDAVFKVRETLGLAEEPLLKASYIAMLMTYLQEHGLPERTITFASPAAKPS